MRIDILTLFPQVFELPFKIGIFQRAIDRKLIDVNIHNIRDYTHDKHHMADDYPYGGGAGMVLKPEPIFRAVDDLKKKMDIVEEESTIISLTPQGRLFCQAIAQELSFKNHLILICGHYEGVDERVNQYLATDEISIGDYVLSGGEPAALVVIDAVTRLIPGVLGSSDSLEDDSYTNGLLEYPQYTRPAVFREWQVPDILLSGNHAHVAKWRRQQSILRTLKRRPELLDKVKLNSKEKQYINRLLIDQSEEKLD
ncbi:MAG: tRNA (guanosine(37)-N1)-methyltransferase TrmD [Dehalococcoidia bacterium]|nr:MAG: tRNA (guanosine(37)-N1)-methyltransferase TrmD [Dehalococcoidia bacterium]